MKHLATTLIGAVTLCAIAPGCLAAEPSNDLRRQVVRFADLDVTRAAGAQQLYRRIKQAAHEVCAGYGPGGYDHRCAEQAVARAVAEVDAPLLTAQHQVLAQRPSARSPQAQQARLDR